MQQPSSIRIATSLWVGWSAENAMTDNGYSITLAITIVRTSDSSRRATKDAPPSHRLRVGLVVSFH